MVVKDQIKAERLLIKLNFRRLVFQFLVHGRFAVRNEVFDVIIDDDLEAEIELSNQRLNIALPPGVDEHLLEHGRVFAVRRFFQLNRFLQKSALPIKVANVIPVKEQVV